MQLGQDLDGTLLQGAVRVVGQECGHQRGVVGARLELAGVDVELVELDGHVGDQLLQLAGVGQVAVVAQRDGSVGGGPEGRLGVVPGAGAGRGVARVTDREVALERRERGLVEDLRDQAHVLVDEDLAAVADRDPGRLLSAVLQGVEAVVGQLGDVLPGRPHAEDATGVLGCRGHGGRGRVSGVRLRDGEPPSSLGWPRGSFLGWPRGRVYVPEEASPGAARLMSLRGRRTPERPARHASAHPSPRGPRSGGTGARSGRRTPERPALGDCARPSGRRRT